MSLSLVAMVAAVRAWRTYQQTLLWCGAEPNYNEERRRLLGAVCDDLLGFYGNADV